MLKNFTLGGKKKKIPFEDDPRPLCNIRFKVRGATNLPNTDSSDLKEGANIADPYVVVFLDQKEQWRTKVIDGQLNPIWDQTYNGLSNIDVFKHRNVQFLVRDKNGGPRMDTNIGYVDFFIQKLVKDRLRQLNRGEKTKEDPTYDKKFDIKPAKWLRKKCPDRVDFGRIHIRIDVEANAALRKKIKELRHKTRTESDAPAALELKKNESISSRLGKDHSGFLYKEGKGILARKETRFFEFDSPMLSYYEDDYHGSDNPEKAKKEMLCGTINVNKELIMVRDPSIVKRGDAEFELLVLFHRVRDRGLHKTIRIFKLEADTNENAAKWIRILNRYCKRTTRVLIEGHMESVEVIGVRTLDEDVGPGKYTSYTIRVKRLDRDDNVSVYERCLRFSDFKRILKPRMECLLSDKGLKEKKLVPKFPSDHTLDAINPFGASKASIVQDRIRKLQDYADSLFDLARRQPKDRWWWMRRLLTQFFAPKGADVPLLRRLRDLVEKEDQRDYSKVKRVLEREFGTHTYLKYRDVVRLEMRKKNRADAYISDGNFGSNTTAVENAERKLAFLDYVQNPFKILGTVGSLPEKFLNGAMKAKYEEIRTAKFHGTLMKTTSDFSSWERRWCRIPKDGGVLRRSSEHPFKKSIADVTAKIKNIDLAGARIEMGRTLWHEEAKKNAHVGRLHWPPTPFWFKLTIPAKDGSKSTMTWYFCTYSKSKLIQWVEALNRERDACSPLQTAFAAAGLKGGGASKVVESSSTSASAIVAAQRQDKIELLMDRIQKVKTRDDAIKALDDVIDECKHLGAFEVDAIVEEIYESIAGNEYMESIKKSDPRGCVVRRLLKLEHLQGAEYSESAIAEFKKNVVGESSEQVKKDNAEEGEKETKERENAKKLAEENERLAATTLSAGEWQVHVHVIQFKDLVNVSSASSLFGGDKKQDMGSVDAVTYVDSFEQSDHTTIKKGVTSGIVDEVLVIRHDVKKVDTLEKEQICVMICDAHKWGTRAHREVGSFTFDLTDVYYRNKNHEYYKQWVALVRKGKTEISGYLQVTMTVLGPGDKKTHHKDEGDIDYNFDDTMFGVGKGQELLMPPGLARTKKWLALTIYHGEDMPRITSTGCSGMSVQVELDHEIAETMVADRPQDTFAEVDNCYFTETIWMPVMLPTMATRIALKLFPHFALSGKGSLPISTAYVKLSTILDARSTAPQWLNLYGPAVGVLYQEDSDLTSQQSQIVGAVRTALKDSIDLIANNELVSKLREGFNKASPHDVAVMMAMSPPMASTYRGRLLVSTRVVSEPPKNAKEMGLSFWRKHFSSKKTRLEDPFKTRAFPVDFSRSLYGARSPATRRLRVVVQAIAGAHLPDTSSLFDLKKLVAEGAVKIGSVLPGRRKSDDLTAGPSASNLSSDTRYFVEVVWGDTQTPIIDMSRPAVGTRGFLHWRQTLDAGERDVVSDPDQVPDMFIYLVKANGDRSHLDRTRLAFIRLRGRDLVEELGFEDCDPEWMHLKLDKSLSKSEDDFCGSLYLRIGVGTPEQWKREWPESERKKEEKDRNPKFLPLSWRVPPIGNTRYELRLHLFRGRQLPVADENGFSDPFVKVLYCGAAKSGPIINRTLNPNWYTTLFIHFDGPWVGRDFAKNPYLKSLLPPVFVCVQDHDAFVNDDLGMCYHLIPQESIVGDDRLLTYRKNVPEPTWHSLVLGGKPSGEVLLSSQLCALTSKDEVLTRPPATFLEPETMRVLLEVFVLGLRDMKGRFGGRPVKPFVRFSVGEQALTTAPSAKPTRSNPNYLVRIQEVVELPIDQLFMPTLRMEAVDCYVGGRIKQIIAAYELPLDDKTEWTQSKGGWVQQYFKDKAFDMFNPKSGRQDAVKINQRISKAGLYFEDFLDAQAKYENDLDAYLRDNAEALGIGDDESSSSDDDSSDTDEEDAEGKDGSLSKEDRKRKRKDKRKAEKRRDKFITIARKLSSSTSESDRLSKLARNYIRVREFVDKFHFAEDPKLKLREKRKKRRARRMKRRMERGHKGDDPAKGSSSSNGLAIVSAIPA
eukprot:g2448.t1